MRWFDRVLYVYNGILYHHKFWQDSIFNQFVFVHCQLRYFTASSLRKVIPKTNNLVWSGNISVSRQVSSLKQIVAFLLACHICELPTQHVQSKGAGWRRVQRAGLDPTFYPGSLPGDSSFSLTYFTELLRRQSGEGEAYEHNPQLLRGWDKTVYKYITSKP